MRPKAAVWLDAVAHAEPAAGAAQDASGAAPSAVARRSSALSRRGQRARRAPSSSALPRSDALPVAPSAPQGDVGLAAHEEGESESVGSEGAAGLGAGAEGAGVGSDFSGSGAADLSRDPGLIAGTGVCADAFPEGAHVTRGEAQIDVEVDALGRPLGSAVLVESPRGQGFGEAARACAQRLRFAPAVGKGGAPTQGHARLKLRFRRRAAG